MTSREHQSSLFIFKIEVVVFNNQWSLCFEILQKVRIIPYYDKKLIIVDFFKTEDLLPVNGKYSFFLQLFTNTEAKKLTAYLSQCCRSNPVRHQMDIILFSYSLGSCNLLDMSCMLWTVPQHMSLKWWLEIIMILPFYINLYPIKKSIAQYHAIISDINILWLIIVTIKPLNSWKDQHLISLYTLNTESNILVIRIQYMTNHWRSTWLLNNFSLSVP